MRRRLLLGAALLAPGCSVLPSQKLEERREWPLVVDRPQRLPPRPRGPVLLVRSVQAGPGLGQRGLQWLQPDGSVRIDFYEQWAVPPAQGVEASLRAWLAASGLFAAVLAPGSRMRADWVLEAELTQLLADVGTQQARVALSAVLIDDRGGSRPVRQQMLGATAVLRGSDVPGVVTAELEAVAGILGQVEGMLRAAV